VDTGWQGQAEVSVLDVEAVHVAEERGQIEGVEALDGSSGRWTRDLDGMGQDNLLVREHVFWVSLEGWSRDRLHAEQGMDTGRAKVNGRSWVRKRTLGQVADGNKWTAQGAHKEPVGPAWFRLRQHQEMS
jgi:hypothetical protein